MTVLRSAASTPSSRSGGTAEIEVVDVGPALLHVLGERGLGGLVADEHEDRHLLAQAYGFAEDQWTALADLAADHREVEVLPGEGGDDLVFLVRGRDRDL